MSGVAMDLMMAPHVLRAESCELVATVDYVILPGVTYERLGDLSFAPSRDWSEGYDTRS